MVPSLSVSRLEQWQSEMLTCSFCWGRKRVEWHLLFPLKHWATVSCSEKERTLTVCSFSRETEGLTQFFRKNKRRKLTVSFWDKSTCHILSREVSREIVRNAHWVMLLLLCGSELERMVDLMILVYSSWMCHLPEIRHTSRIPWVLQDTFPSEDQIHSHCSL